MCLRIIAPVSKYFWKEKFLNFGVLIKNYFYKERYFLVTDFQFTYFVLSCELTLSTSAYNFVLEFDQHPKHLMCNKVRSSLVPRKG